MPTSNDRHLIGPVIGPIMTDVRGAQSTLENLWAQTEVEMRAYTGNIVALTEKKHLDRVLDALATLGGRYAGRQIVGLMDGDESVAVEASLIPQRGVYVERLILDANSEQLQGAILPLLRTATVNHVWWASDAPPAGPLLAELSELADQVIADTLSLGIPTDGRYALSDLGWARTSGWREAVAQLFDTHDALTHLGSIETVTIRHAGTKDLPARLFAGWVASCLGWEDTSRCRIESEPGAARENSDLTCVELRGEGVRFSLESREGHLVHSVSEYGVTHRENELHLPPLSLGEGLGFVMSRPERHELFERALRLAKGPE